MSPLRRVLLGLLRAVIITGLPPVIALSGLYVLMSPAYLRYEYGRANSPSPTRAGGGKRYSAAVECVRYLHTKAGIEVLQKLEGSEGPLFNERELHHMVDVKGLTQRALIFHRVCTVLVLGAVLYLARYGPRREWARRLVQGAGLTITLVALLLVAAMVNFSWFFTLFHRIFFEGDTWLFPYTDTLIQLFPLRFWFDIVQLWVLGTILLSCIIGGLALWWLRRSMPS
ncbi:MAG: TIGR01906 family membrane protein [Chloroflexota bacterium]|nr:TIGR01906 family membrane protein [Chloroflexota bacterium]